MSNKILFVDDEPNVLQSIQRSFRKRYSLDTASSGAAALEILDRNGPYAVVVSDMQMPEMNGAELLSLVKKRAPFTARMMLTGNADQQTAIDAINKGDILRFLNKPSSADAIAEALEAGLAHHRLVCAEKELLEDTLRGCVEALVEVLALSNPDILGRSTRLKNRVSQVAVQMSLNDIWQMETVALLSQIGCVSIPSELVKRKLAGGKLASKDQVEFSSHAAAGADLLSKIPRMEEVAEAIRYQEKYYDGSGMPSDGVSADEIPLAARILRPILDLDSFECAGETSDAGYARLKQHSDKYDPSVLAALEPVIAADNQWQIRSIPLSSLRDELRLASDIYTSTGTLLVVKGQRTSLSVRRHLRSYCEKGLIAERLDVWQKDEAASAGQ